MLFCHVVVLLVVGAHAMPPTDRVVDVDADASMEEARRLMNAARELEEESPIPGLTGTVLSGFQTIASNYENDAATTAFGHHFHLARGEYCHFVRRCLASRDRIDAETRPMLDAFSALWDCTQGANEGPSNQEQGQKLFDKFSDVALGRAQRMTERAVQHQVGDALDVGDAVSALHSNQQGTVGQVLAIGMTAGDADAMWLKPWFWWLTTGWVDFERRGGIQFGIDGYTKYGKMAKPFRRMFRGFHKIYFRVLEQGLVNPKGEQCNGKGCDYIGKPMGTGNGPSQSFTWMDSIVRTRTLSPSKESDANQKLQSLWHKPEFGLCDYWVDYCPCDVDGWDFQEETNLKRDTRVAANTVRETVGLGFIGDWAGSAVQWGGNAFEKLGEGLGSGTMGSNILLRPGSCLPAKQVLEALAGRTPSVEEFYKLGLSTKYCRVQC